MDISEVKRNMNRMVRYRGRDDVYMLTGCMLRREIGDGEFWYQVELADINASCLVYDDLERIESIRKGEC